MAVSPDPKLLLEPDENEVTPLLNNYFLQAIPTVLGVIGVLWRRSARRRPLWSGIHEHAIAATIGFGVGTLLQTRYDRYHSIRDSVARHYIQLHPEDFPMPERKKIGELFEQWTPIR